MPSTVGVWAHQLPHWFPGNAIKSRFRPTVITSGGRSRALADDYVVLDVDALKRFGGFDVRRELGTSDPMDASIVVDATGARPPMSARQLAFGQVFPEAAIPEATRVPVLMDFTVPVPNHGNAALVPGDVPASFSYRLPLGDGTWLIEETILAVRVEGANGDECRLRLLDHLNHLQSERLTGLGVDGADAVGEETVDFALGPRHLSDAFPRGKPASGHAAFGAGAAWLHPATGYSVGTLLYGVDDFLDSIVEGKKASPPGGRALAWLRRRGLHVLLGFDAEETRRFFDAFFTLPDRAIREYLTGTTAIGTMGVMIRLAGPLARRTPRDLVTLLILFAGGKQGHKC